MAENTLVDCFNARAYVDSEYIDLSKAFDSISNKKLLLKLRAYGINSNGCSWLEHYLLNRLQRVIVNDCMSGWLQCTNGVSQGVSLTPFYSLFILMTYLIV